MLPIIPFFQQVLSKANIPYISYGSGSSGLGDSTTFPFFLRTYPAVDLQILAIMRVVLAVGWRRLALITSPDEFGTDSFQAVQGICLQQVRFTFSF
jgi:hypothetical protein